MSGWRCQRGFSLVELMVSLALGLFVISVALSVLAIESKEQSRLRSTARLEHDLRVAIDHVSRGVRRAGHWGDPTAALWTPASASGPRRNPYAGLEGGGSQVGFRYSRDETEDHLVASAEEFGFRLKDGVIESRVGASGWQALTDPAAMRVETLRLTPAVHEVSLAASCSLPCPVAASAAPGGACPPRQQIRQVRVAVEARLPRDPSTVRALEVEVRLRNDALVGACAT